MSPVSTNPSVVPTPSILPPPKRPVPSLDELERMTSVPDERRVIQDVDWAFYEQLVDSIPGGANIHVDYDGKDLEIMSKGANHEDVGELLDKLVSLIAYELNIPFRSFGETTWKRPELARGLEADKSYYFTRAKLDAVAAARRSKNIADYPNPDLAIEVDISRPEIDRQGIYAALRVTEVWRFDSDQLIIERLSEDGSFVRVDASGFLPIRSDEIVRWVVREDFSDESAWARRLRAWVQAELIARVPR
jgi:Uma2 family endonuclease